MPKTDTLASSIEGAFGSAVVTVHGQKGEPMLKVPYGQDPYSVIGKYIRDHITAIEDMIAVIEIDDITTNQLFMVDMNEENYFIWNNDWYEGEKDVALIDFFPVSEAINPSVQPNTDEWCHDCKEYDQSRHCCPRWNRVIRETLKDAQPEPQWIPCSERLPEVGTYVLVSKKSLGFRSNLPNVYTAHRSHDPRSGKEEWNDMLFGKLDDDDVLAWMPLPEPYGGEQE